MAIVERTITQIVKDAAGNIQANKTLKFTPLTFNGDAGIMSVLKVVKGKTNADGELKHANGTDPFTLLTNDDADAFVRYSVLFPGAEKTTRKFDLAAGSATTLDLLINAYAGQAIASDAIVLADILDRLTDIETNGLPASPVGAAGGVLGGTYPNPGFAVDMATQAELTAGLSGKADSLGADDNYVTDAEKVKLGNLSGTNTGDQDLSPYFHKTNDDSDDITAGVTNKFVTTAEKTKLANLSGTNSGDQNLFSTIAVAGQSNVVADSASDTLTFVAGSNVTITTNATTDEITIAATGGGAGGGTVDTANSPNANEFARFTDADTIEGLTVSETKTALSLNNVDNTADASKPVSTAQQTALDLKAPIASPTFTGTVGGITKSMVGLGNVDNTADTAKPVSTAQQTALDLKAPIASPTFTGTVGGITKSMVGLGNVDNTADTAKPVSTAQQTALDLKAPIASPTFTGTVGGITKSMVGLGNVPNADTSTTANITDSANKRFVTDAQQTVLGNTSGTNTGDQTLPTRASLGLATSDSPQFTGIELGHATDTTVTRSAAGVIAVEGVTVPLNSITNTHTAQQIELGHASDTTITRTSAGNIAVEGNNIYRAGGSFVGMPEIIGIACSDETTAITTGTAKATFRMPFAMTVTAVRASVTTAPTGSTILIDINEGGTTILSTKLMIDASEKTSTTAATPYVLSDTALADDAEMTIDFDQVGATIAGTGVKVWIIGTRA